MSLSERAEHLYVIDKKGERVIVSFLTRRGAYFIPIILVFSLCFALIKVALHWNWNGNVISCIVGASISFVAVTCFAMFGHIVRYVITIEPDLVSIQRTLEGIPIGSKEMYSRSMVTDLGVYPIEIRGEGSFRLGRLCLWVGKRSVQLENYFPIREGAALATDLHAIGISFPQTQLAYDDERSIFSDDYQSF
jgi:hypothetical protein